MRLGKRKSGPSPLNLTSNQNERRNALALVLAGEHVQPLDGIDPDAVLDKVLEQQPESADGQEEEAPVDESREVVEARAP